MKRCHVRCMLAQAFLRLAACGSLCSCLETGYRVSATAIFHILFRLLSVNSESANITLSRQRGTKGILKMTVTAGHVGLQRTRPGICSGACATATRRQRGTRRRPPSS